MKKRILSVLLCAAMATSLVAGCGGGKDAAEGNGDGGKKLVYWSMWSDGEPQAKVIKAAVEKYEKDTGVDVDVQFKGRNGQREGLGAALDKKQTIDLFDEDVNRVNGSWGKYLMDLEDLAKDFEAEHGQEKLYEVARAAGGGTLKTIPYQPSIFGFLYNKALFKQAGIEAAPKTWAEFDEACAKLKAAGITPITGDTTYQSSALGYHLARYIGQDGVKALVNDPQSKNPDAVNWDNEKVLKAVKDYEDFANKGYFSANMAGNVYPDGQNKEFAPGKAAMIICGTWLPNEIKGMVASDFEWGYFNYPAVEGGADDTTANNIACQVFGINKDSKMSKEAMELITYITSGEFDTMMTKEALCIPADKTNNEWPAQLTEVQSEFNATTTFYDWAVGVLNNGDLATILEDGFVKVLAGQMTAEKFVEECAEICGE